MDVRIKRIYDAAHPDDGARVLVDRLWPRGVRRADAALDAWVREAAPSPELRRWFGHAPERFAEFAQRYREELDARADAVAGLRDMAASGRVTLLYAARDPDCNHARVLAEYLRDNSG